MAHWLFLDAAVLSSHYRPPPDAPYDSPVVHVTFVDWVPGILSVLGFLVVNLIDKDRIKGEEAYADSRAVWRARLFLFIGFALMAGGLAGSVVCSLVLTLVFSILTCYHADDSCLELCCTAIPSVFWIRECWTEHRYNVIRSRLVACTKCTQ